MLFASVSAIYLFRFAYLNILAFASELMQKAARFSELLSIIYSII